MRRTGTTRRGALTATGAAAVAAVLAGCGGGDDSADNRRAAAAAEVRASAARAERALRAGAARVSGQLLTGYEQVLTAHPTTAARLTPLRDAVERHVRALTPDGVPTRTPGTSPPPPPAPTRPPTAGPGAAVKELAAAERRTADTHAATLLEAEPELARLLASVAAAGAAHAYLLTELARELPA
ncbi:hypothetical protein ACPXCE_13990 [Streptomyces sp. DT24]|uniref:hypothetical protein n=1 Tax=Streptomyces sp. DT24 TaxID=3416520 RepID=UPI003CE85874